MLSSPESDASRSVSPSVMGSGCWAAAIAPAFTVSAASGSALLAAAGVLLAARPAAAGLLGAAAAT